MSELDNIRVVLVETTHPGNIGASARAMKTMGLSRLYLVKPHSFPSAEATARASGADDLLANAVICESLQEALSGCIYVAGASARTRSLAWPQLSPEECARGITENLSSGAMALVFGRESRGLTNVELACCQHLVHIPCNPDFGSLNLAAAVQILAYELRKHLLQVPVPPIVSSQAAIERRAVFDELEGFYQHLEAVLLEIEFLDPENPRNLMRHLRRLYNRVDLSLREVNILRGILTAFQRSQR